GRGRGRAACGRSAGGPGHRRRADPRRAGDAEGGVDRGRPRSPAGARARLRLRRDGHDRRLAGRGAAAVLLRRARRGAAALDMARNAWFETVAEAQRRAHRRLPAPVYGALVAGCEAGLTCEDNMTAFAELGFAP